MWRNDFLSSNSVNVQSPPLLEYWPRTDVRTLKECLNISVSKTKTCSNTKSFQSKDLFNPLSKVATNKAWLLFVQLLSHSLKSHLTDHDSWQHHKTALTKSKMLPKTASKSHLTSPLCWFESKNGREAVSWFWSSVRKRTGPFQREIKNWNQTSGLSRFIGFRDLEYFSLRPYPRNGLKGWRFTFPGSIPDPPIQLGVKRNMATTTGN